MKLAGPGALLTCSASLELAALSVGPAPPCGSAGWPMYRGNRCLTGRAVLPGEMVRAPEVSWRYPIEAGLVWAVLDPTPGKGSGPNQVQPSQLATDYFHSPEGRRWELGAKLADLDGTGQRVPDPGRAAKLLPDVAGLQTIEFQPAPNASGLDPKQAVCSAYA